MAQGTVTSQIFASHLMEGPSKPKPGDEVALRIDQTLTQDATGTLVMLELEALGLERPRVDVAAQYIDHNLLQEDFKNADDHLFLLSAARRFGLRLAWAGTGVSHPVHMAKVAAPGRTLLGADSHTCASGALGMVAIGAGGVEVAMAIAGEPFYVEYPEVWGVWLEGELPPLGERERRHPRDAPPPWDGRREGARRGVSYMQSGTTWSTTTSGPEYDYIGALLWGGQHRARIIPFVFGGCVGGDVQYQMWY